VHYQKRGFKSCIVCADTFRAGAFDQTRQSATKAKVAYFWSYTETDRVSIAKQGVIKFKKERFEVIIVDTSGRHKQESELFEEMVQIGEAVQPNMTVLILDASIGIINLLLWLGDFFTKLLGQAAEAQSQAFKESADFGAIIVTKNGTCKGRRGNFSYVHLQSRNTVHPHPDFRSVASYQDTYYFPWCRRHLHDLDRFSPQPFISKLLGLGDVQGLMEHMQDIATQNPGQTERNGQEARRR